MVAETGVSHDNHQLTNPIIKLYLVHLTIGRNPDSQRYFVLDIDRFGVD